MANITETLNEIMQIEHAIAASIVDASSGLMLGSQGRGIDLELASANNTDLYLSQQKIMSSLGIRANVVDFLITLDTQYHILTPVHQDSEVFIYFVMGRNGTLALARRKLTDAAEQLVI